MKKNTLYIVIGIIAAVFIIIIASSSFYQVGEKEQAVVTRFNKFVRLEGPGLKWKAPFIEKKFKIPIKEIQKLEFGFVTTRASTGKSDFYRGDEQIKEARMLTADLKIIQIEWIVQYKITDPKAYLFNVRHPKASLEAFSEISMSQAAGDYLFDEIITIAKSELTEKVSDLLRDIIEDMNMGVSIQTVKVINVTPPEEVEAAYNEVVQAQQEMEKINNEAKQEYNERVIPVRGKAEKMIAEAEGYKEERIKTAEGEALYFNSLYTEYIKAPQITKKRMYLETMTEIYPKLNNIYVIDEDQKNLVPLMQMGIKDIRMEGE